MTDIDRVAIVVARGGADHVAHLEAIIARARALLDDPAIAIIEPTRHYDWETDRDGAQRATLYAGTATDHATGEGMTAHYLFTRARSDADFRRQFARRFGAGLADTADVRAGLAAALGIGDLVLSNRMRAMVAQVSSEGQGPGGFSYSASLHLNYS